MPVALEQFVKQIADSGVIAPGKLENFLPPKAFPKDTQELARQLVQSKHLTKFQAQEIYAGRAKSLILGNYTILDKIGAGGMGQVFKAEHRRMHRLVAIKMLPAATMKDAAAVARFQREVEAAAKLRHPNIVATDDADEAGGVHFLVMEYVEGADLSALVKKSGPLPVAKAVNYILQAARGLEFAHGEGVVHRDIKPANLLVDKKGTVKILDMGLARIDGAGDTATQAELTGTGAVLGTVDYMAPEQALSTKHVDGRADIYSMGCTLHYLLTAHAAYDGDTLMAKLLAHREQPIPSLGAEVPDEVQAVFEKMVAKKVQDRYQTMSEVVAALEQCNSGRQTSVSFQQSVDTNLDADVLTFLRDAPPHASHVQKKTKKAAPTKTAKKVTPSKSGNDNKKLILGAVGAGFLGVAILAGVIFKLRTKDGTLVVEVNQPDAVVQVLDADGKVEISQPGGKGPVTISVDPGKHRLKVEKDGFKFFAKDFEMESGGEKSIKAQLIPLGGKPVTAGTEKALAFKTPGFDQWVKTVAPLPAEKQVDAVAKKLQELNPGFDGRVTPKIEGGVVTEVDFATDNVTDISPVRVLQGLKALRCRGSVTNEGKLSDLSPLHGMPLTALSCDYSQVSNLSPLKGMPLTELWLGTTRVSDMSPLSGIPLNTLSIIDTQVSDLSSINDLRLKEMFFTPQNITKGMNTLRSSKSVETIGVAWGSRWKTQEFWKKYDAGEFGKPDSTAASPAHKPITNINDPAFQQWMKTVAAMPAEQQVEAVGKKLKELNPGFDGKLTGWLNSSMPPTIENGVVTKMAFFTDLVSDISPVRALPGLNSLDCSGRELRGQLSDLSPLKGLPLKRLICYGNGISELAPLKGMPLELLSIDHTPVSDLSQITGFRLTYLSCAATPVSDLSPLHGMPLGELYFYDTRVSDISTLQGTELTKIEFTPKNIVKGLDVVRQMKSLKQIGVHWTKVYNADEFWKKYDAGEFGKPDSVASSPDHKPITNINDPAFQQWMKTVAAMSAEQQVEAVAKKLQELNPGLVWRTWNEPTIENGVVTGIAFDASQAADISPVRGLPGLSNLCCSCSCDHLIDGKSDSKFCDLSPLRGLKLTNLDCTCTAVADLSPLTGMPLTRLLIGGTPAGDLSPLKGMPLNLFACNSSQVSDLSPLEGMSLTELYVTPKEITKGWDVVRRMKSLRIIDVGEGNKFQPADFWKKCDAGEFGKPDSTAVKPDRKPITNINDPAFQQWMKTVAALPAERQVEAVSKKLQELNPGFDGKEGHKIEGDVVVELKFAADDITDVSPVRALLELKELSCTGSGVGKSKLSDLSPLKGMRLERLECWRTLISDLSPLEGMPLTFLTCPETPVSDLSPLKGMPLTRLDCQNTQISDLSPLHGMKLVFLPCYNTHVSDLSPLRGMPLAFLSCGGTQVSDLKPLKGMPLTNLNCCATQVSDLSPLENMPLTELSFFNTNVSDLTPLERMNLTEVNLTPQNITKGINAIRQMKSLQKIGTFPTAEFWKKYDAGEFGTPNSASLIPDQKPITTFNDPAFQQWMKSVAALSAEKQVQAVVKKLQELNPGFDGKEEHRIENGVVTDLHFQTNNVTDISPVRALAGLKDLRCPGSEQGKRMLSDLSPLEGLHLTNLDCGYSQVSTLLPLAGMRLTGLVCWQTAVSDLTPLQGMPLKGMLCNNTKISDLSPLKGMALTDMNFPGTQVSDLSPLAGMPLTHLDCGWTPVSTLAPLKGMPLAFLNCCGTQVSDLSPLKNMPLTELSFFNTNVSDVSLLERMNLTEANFTPKNITKGINVIRQMKSLQKIGVWWDDKNKFPTAEFWRKYDAGEFNK